MCQNKGCCNENPCVTCKRKSCPDQSGCLEKALCAIKDITICDEKYQTFQYTASVSAVTITVGDMPADANKIKVFANGQRIPYGIPGNYFFTRSGANLNFNKPIPGSIDEPTWILVEFCENKTIEDIVEEEYPDITFCC